MAARRHPLARTLACCAALSATLLTPAFALADADPASDVLLGASVFYPYSPAVSQPLQQGLNAAVAAAGQAHFPIKVALIDTPVDLGAVPALFGKPQQYATFLDQEISFNTKQELLVVMPGGYGVDGLPPAATALVTSLPKPAGPDSDALAQAAIAAVAKLASAAGHPVAAATTHGPASRSSKNTGGGGGSPVLIIAVLAVVALGVAGGVIALRRRAR